MYALAISVLLMANPASGPALPKVASPEWSLAKIDRALGGFYADHFSSALRAQGFEVVTSKDIAAILGQERQKQLLGCTDESNSCLTELGNALGCDGMLLVSLAKLDDSFRGTIRIVSSSNAKVMAETNLEASSERGLLTELDDAAVRLGSSIRGVSAPLKKGSVKSLSWVPAVVAAAGAAVAVIGFAGAGDKYAAAQAPQLDPTAFSLTVKEGKNLQVAGWVGASVGVAALVTAGVMFFTGEPAPTVSPTVMVMPSGASVGLSGAF